MVDYPPVCTFSYRLDKGVGFPGGDSGGGAPGAPPPPKQPKLRFHYLLKFLILMSFRGASPPRAPHRALPWTRWGPWPSPIQGAPTNVYFWIRAWYQTGLPEKNIARVRDSVFRNVLCFLLA